MYSSLYKDFQLSPHSFHYVNVWNWCGPHQGRDVITVLRLDSMPRHKGVAESSWKMQRESGILSRISTYFCEFILPSTGTSVPTPS